MFSVNQRITATALIISSHWGCQSIKLSDGLFSVLNRSVALWDVFTCCFMNQTMTHFMCDLTWTSTLPALVWPGLSTETKTNGSIFNPEMNCEVSQMYLFLKRERVEMQGFNTPTDFHIWRWKRSLLWNNSVLNTSIALVITLLMNCSVSGNQNKIWDWPQNQQTTLNE